MSAHEPQHAESVKSESDNQLDEPPLYRVLLLNDDYTTMEFVIEVLRVVFHKTEQEATKIMLDVHKKGSGICGTYAYDIARTKVRDVLQRAKAQSFPLRCEYQEVPR